MARMIDMITYEKIEAPNLVEIKEGERIYTFDISTLCEYTNRYKKYNNPFTENPLPAKVIERIEKYNQIDVTIKTITGGEFNLAMKRNNTIAELFIEFSKKSNITDVPGIEIIYQGRCLLENLNKNIGSFGKNPLFYMKLILIRRYYEEQYILWEKYISKNSAEWLREYIPPYPRTLESQDEPTERGYIEIIDLILFAENNESLIKNLKDFIFLTGVKITTNEARMICNIIPDFPDKYICEHWIYSRVTDKYNLKPTSGIEAYYSLPEGVNNYDLQLNNP